MRHTTFRQPTSIGLVALAAVFELLSSSTMAVPITTTKDSADFPHLYDGADLPNSVGWSVASNTPAGSVVNTTQMQYAGGSDNGADKGHYGWDDSSIAHAAGWTVELRYQITAATDAGNGVFGMLLGNGSSVADYTILDFHEDMVGLDGSSAYEMYATNVDFTDGFHVVRVAQPANGGDGDMHLWVDGMLVADNLTGQVVDGLTRTWLGNRTGQLGGQAVVDWIRIDNTGGFAPIPEPSGICLSLIAVAALCGRGWLRRKAMT